MSAKGIITRITGPVVDIRFPSAEHIPDIFHAVEVKVDGETYTLETLQQLGNGEVRCISMHSTDGMSRGMAAVDTGAPISIPVSEALLGRMIDVTGQPIDRGGPIAAAKSGPYTIRRRSLPTWYPPRRFWKPASRSSIS